MARQQGQAGSGLFAGLPPFVGRARLAFAIMLVFLPVSAQVRPNAPINDIYLPMFAEDGYKIWEMRADVGTYVSESMVEVEGLWLKLLDGNQSMSEIATIRSPQAKIDVDKRIAGGREELSVFAEDFSLQGMSWTWEANEKRLIVRKSARVIFQGQMGDILK